MKRYMFVSFATATVITFIGLLCEFFVDSKQEFDFTKVLTVWGVWLFIILSISPFAFWPGSWAGSSVKK